MSRSASEPDSASLRQWEWPVRRIWMKPAIDGESNGRTQPSDFPGWLGTARADRSAEEPGRPAFCFCGRRTAHSSGEAGNDRGAKGLNVSVQL